MEVTIVGEDQATKAVILRLINYVGGFYVGRDLPARGGRVKSLINNFNNLSATQPVVLIIDLDNYSCPPELISSLLNGLILNDNFIVRVAVDEVEAWLMADRTGFAEYFKVPIDKIPASVALSRLKPFVNELVFPYKSSLYMLKEIIPHSRSKSIREDLMLQSNSYKSPLYNPTLLPFITNYWNIDRACENSYSLRKSVLKIQNLVS